MADTHSWEITWNDGIDELKLSVSLLQLLYSISVMAVMLRWIWDETKTMPVRAEIREGLLLYSRGGSVTDRW
jgi:hypothetical protein